MPHSSPFQYLFSSSGRWIAFRQHRYVFDTDSRWIGWLPWENGEVVDTQGQYLGTIFPGDRFYRDLYRAYRGYPGFPGYSPLPPGAVDLPQLSQK